MRYGRLNERYAGHLAGARPEQGGPIWMVNFMRYREWADYADGRPARISGREADDLYAPLDVLAAIGAEVAFFGDAVAQGGERWDRVAIVRYPVRRAFAEMGAREDFQRLHVHKDAGMEFTIIVGALPVRGVGCGTLAGERALVIAYPMGSEPGGSRDGARRFEVEDTIIGDERRWAAIELVRPGIEPELPPGALRVEVAVHIDRLEALLAGT